MPCNLDDDTIELYVLDRLHEETELGVPPKIEFSGVLRFNKAQTGSDQELDVLIPALESVLKIMLSGFCWSVWYPAWY